MTVTKWDLRRLFPGSTESSGLSASGGNKRRTKIRDTFWRFPGPFVFGFILVSLLLHSGNIRSSFMKLKRLTDD
ncbi:hypothetical protein K1719_007967 [Acacia pycnantha]|nr:hypothetical protein K1719_007967 [Acacia pycnantha]